MSTPFWERLTALCAEKDTTPNAVMLKTGLNTGNPTAWRKGRLPGTKAAKSIADYFGVSVDYLLGAEEKENQPTGFDGLTEDEIQLLTAYRAIAEPKKEVYLQIVTQGAEHSP